MANVITILRIMCALGLLVCPTFSTWFYVLYILGGLSDMLDGIVARHLGTESKFGAQLDTIADIVFFGMVITKVIQLISLPVWVILWIIGIAVMKAINILIGLATSQRFVPEHTMLNKISGVLVFTIPICMDHLPKQPTIVWIILTCGVATLAAVQEGYCIRSGQEK